MSPVVIPTPTGTISGIASPRGTVLTSTGQALGTIVGTVSGGSGSGYSVQLVIRRGDGSVCNDWTGAGWSGACQITNPSPTVVGNNWSLSGAAIPPIGQMTSGQTYRVYILVTDSNGKNSGWLFTPLITFQLVNDSQFISQSVPKNILTTNETMNVSVTMRNCRPNNDCSGLTTWNVPVTYGLGAQNPQDNFNWGIARTYIPGATTIAPGAQYTFPFSVTAPGVAGVYNFQWRTLHEAVEWFGATTPNIAITVSTPVPPVPPTVSNVRASIRDYCTNPAGADISWIYSGTGAQSKYQIQVADSRGFGTPAYDSGPVTNSATLAYVSGTGPAGIAPGITWGTTYQARVTVWDGNTPPLSATATQTLCIGSGCIGGASWLTPSAAYPVPSIAHVPDKPRANLPVQFTGSASCLGGGCAVWAWTFDGSTTANGQSVSHTFVSEGAHTAKLEVTDMNGNMCSAVKNLNINKPIPFWKEIIPW